MKRKWERKGGQAKIRQAKTENDSLKYNKEGLIVFGLHPLTDKQLKHFNRNKQKQIEDSMQNKPSSGSGLFARANSSDKKQRNKSDELRLDKESKESEEQPAGRKTAGAVLDSESDHKPQRNTMPVRATSKNLRKTTSSNSPEQKQKRISEKIQKRTISLINKQIEQ